MLEEEFMVKESDVNNFNNKNDVDVEDDVEDEKVDSSDVSESVEVWAWQIPKKNTSPGAPWAREQDK